MHNGDLTARKKRIRGEMRRLRDSLSADDIHSKSSSIECRLWQLMDQRGYESIMFYIAFGSEVRTQNCITKAIGHGKTVIVPVCSADGKRELLPSRLLNFQREVEKNTFGILEPKPEFRRPFSPEKIDLVVAPGVAFDEKGYRIGYGGGYYDRFLTRCPQALHVGLAYEMQMIECVFPSERDVPVHKVITEDRVISCNNE